MGYIITAEFEIDAEVNFGHNLDQLLSNPRIRILREDPDEDFITLDIKGNFSNRKEDVRWFCNALIDAGIIRFKIGHSY